MATYNNFFKYINFILVFFIACSLMYNDNLELIGIGLSFITSILINLFLFIEIISSPKNYDIVVIIIAISMISLFISIVMFSIMITKTHYNYSKKKSRIILTKYTKDQIELYKKLFITDNIFIWILSLIYFSLLKITINNNNNSNELKLINYYKKLNENISEIYYPFYDIEYISNYSDYFFIFFKTIITGSVLGISGYMIYLSLELSKVNSKNIYISENSNTQTDEELDLNIYYEKNKNSIFNIFRNLNMDYIINSRMMLNL